MLRKYDTKCSVVTIVNADGSYGRAVVDENKRITSEEPFMVSFPEKLLIDTKGLNYRDYKNKVLNKIKDKVFNVTFLSDKHRSIIRLVSETLHICNVTIVTDGKKILCNSELKKLIIDKKVRILLTDKNMLTKLIQNDILHIALYYEVQDNNLNINDFKTIPNMIPVIVRGYKPSEYENIPNNIKIIGYNIPDELNRFEMYLNFINRGETSINYKGDLIQMSSIEDVWNGDEFNKAREELKCQK